MLFPEEQPEQPDPPCVADLCNTVYRFGQVNVKIGGTELHIINLCPRHGDEYKTILNGATLYKMVENGNPMGEFLVDRLNHLRSQEIEAEQAEDLFRPANAMMPRYRSVTAAQTLLMEYANAYHNARYPGQRGLNPP